eukprot:UN05622
MMVTTSWRDGSLTLFELSLCHGQEDRYFLMPLSSLFVKPNRLVVLLATK